MITVIKTSIIIIKSMTLFKEDTVLVYTNSFCVVKQALFANVYHARQCTSLQNTIFHEGLKQNEKSMKIEHLTTFIFR